MKILRGNYPPISKTYSKDLSDLISNLLKKNPEERPTVNQILQKPFLAVGFPNYLETYTRSFGKV